MSEVPQYIKLYPGKEEEELKHHLYSYITSKFRNFKPEDLDLKITLYGGKKPLRCMIGNAHFNPKESDFSYYYEFAKDCFDGGKKQMKYFNEFNGGNINESINTAYMSYPVPQVYQLNPLSINNDKKFVKENLSYEDYSMYVTIPFEYFNEDTMLYFLDLKKRFPPEIKKYHAVLLVDPAQFNELKIIGFLTQIRLDNEGQYAQFTSIFPLLYSKKDKNMIRYLGTINTCDSYMFVTDKEGRTKTFMKSDLDSKDKEKDDKQIKKMKNRIHPLSKEEYEDIEEIGRLKSILAKVPYYYNADYQLKFTATLSKDCSHVIPKAILKFTMNCELMPKELELVKKYKKKYYTDSSNFKIREIQLFTVDLSTWTESKCANPSCNTILTKKDKFYYCYWCKIFYCEKCVEDTFNKETQNLREKYIHKEHNLLYITTTEQKYLTNLSKGRLGNNIFADEENKLTFNARIHCSGCSKDIEKNYRYLCMSCKPGARPSKGYIDFCYDCMVHMRNDDEEGKKMQERNLILEDPDTLSNYKAIPKNHCHSKHIYLLLIASVDNYFDY